MKTARLITAVTTFLIALCCSLTVSAATVTNVTPSIDPNWSNPANWIGGVSPTNGDSVVLAVASGMAPTNLDITGLNLNILAFSNILATGVGYTNPVYGATLIGNDFKVNGIECL